MLKQLGVQSVPAIGPGFDVQLAEWDVNGDFLGCGFVRKIADVAVRVLELLREVATRTLVLRRAAIPRGRLRRRSSVKCVSEIPWRCVEN